SHAAVTTDPRAGKRRQEATFEELANNVSYRNSPGGEAQTLTRARSCNRRERVDMIDPVRVTAAEGAHAWRPSGVRAIPMGPGQADDRAKHERRSRHDLASIATPSSASACQWGTQGGRRDPGPHLCFTLARQLASGLNSSLA